ncbi:hypothetical protein LINPERPRIM_LOCUS597 [Linum perenne]
MADSEKLTALKKAYADIILNTAKEAAARIMMSERKAQRYQRELFAAKDEALRMLLRLKQMFDAKVSEAEMTSLNQLKRIDELEAQLGEAEDIVKDLRSELRELQDELERVMTNQMQPLWEDSHGGHNANEMTLLEHNAVSTPVPMVSSLPSAETDPVAVTEITNSTSTVLYNDHSSKHYSENSSHKDSCFVCDPDFASIMMRNKEPELYKNGCTHRIRALEANILGGSLPIAEQDDGRRQQICNGDDKEGKHACHKLAAKDNIAHGSENNKDEEKIQTGSECIHVYALKSFRRKQKRATRYRKRRVSFRRFPDQNVDNSVECGLGPMRVQGEDSEFEAGRKESPDSNERVRQPRLAEATEGNVNFLRSCSVQSTRSNDKMSMEEEDLKSVECSESLASRRDDEISSLLLLVDSELKESEANPLSNETAIQSRLAEANEVNVKILRPCSVQIARSNDKTSVEEEDLKSVEGSESLASKCDNAISSLLLVERSEPNESVENPLPDETVLQSILAKASKGNVNLLRPCSVQSTRSNDKMSVEAEDLKSVEGSESLASKCCNAVASVLLANSEANECEAKESVPEQPVISKLIKYTFTRKRKRGSASSTDGKSSIEDESLSKRRMDEKQDGPKESVKLCGQLEAGLQGYYVG